MATGPIPSINGNTQARKKGVPVIPGTLRQAANWTGGILTLPSGVLSFSSGAYSFLASNTSIGANGAAEIIANASNRLAYFSFGLGGTLTNYENKNIFGTLGYAFNLFVAPFAPQDLIYPLTGFTSAIDSISLTSETISQSEKLKHLGEKLIEKHNPQNIENFKYTEFNSWGQGFDRTLDAIKESVKDLYNLFDVKNPIKSITEIIKRPDFNLLSSTVGLLTGFFTLVLTPFKTFGKALRDIFALQADVGIYQGGAEGTIKPPEDGMKFTDAGKWRSWGDRLYKSTAPPQVIASILDFTYRMTNIENLHLAALGFDRLGAASFAVGNICHDASKKAGNEYYTAA